MRRNMKIKIKKWQTIQKILPYHYGAISVLWLFGILIQFIQSAMHQEYSMFKEYGHIALTIFGFTLVGGIFETRKKHSQIVRKLFDSSLSFLTTAIAFYFMYSLSSVLTKEMTSMGEIQTGLIVGAFFVAMLIGFYGIILGLLNLYKILVDYRIELDEK